MSDDDDQGTHDDAGIIDLPDDPDNVVHLRKKVEDPTRVFEVIHGHGKCKHPTKLVDGEERTVECEACKAKIDPFDALWSIANDYSNEYQRYRHAVGERRRMEEDLRLLKKQMQRARDALGRARQGLLLAGGDLAELELWRQYDAASRLRDYGQQRAVRAALTKIRAEDEGA